jgi:ssDNA-binding Zn-finger/Zn-ribbon topoisomerase 1
MKQIGINKVGKIVWGEIQVGDTCPYCGIKMLGKIEKRTGKFGDFYSCSNFPACGFSQTINPYDKKI